MDLGIAAARRGRGGVAAGSGSPPRAALADGRRAPSPSAAASQERIDAAAARDRPARGPARRRRVHRGGRGGVRPRRRATRSAASTSSSPTAADRRPATSPSTDLERLPRRDRAQLPRARSRCAARRCPAMQAQRWGRVLAITSVAVRQPIADADPLEHRAAGAHRLPQDARARGRGRRRHRELAPARAPRHRADPRALRRRARRVAAGIPAGVIGDPSDFGRIAAFLCSEPASFVTGAAIPRRRRRVHGSALRPERVRFARWAMTERDSRIVTLPNVISLVRLAVRAGVRLAARRRRAHRRRGAARGARRLRLGRRLDRPPLRPGQRPRARCSTRSPTGCCCSSPRVALLIDGSVPARGRRARARPGGR